MPLPLSAAPPRVLPLSMSAAPPRPRRPARGSANLFFAAKPISRCQLPVVAVSLGTLSLSLPLLHLPHTPSPIPRDSWGRGSGCGQGAQRARTGVNCTPVACSAGVPPSILAPSRTPARCRRPAVACHCSALPSLLFCCRFTLCHFGL